MRGLDTSRPLQKQNARLPLPCFLLPIPLTITLTMGGSTKSHSPPKKKKEKRCVVCVCSVLGWGVSTLAWRKLWGESTWWLAWVGSHLIPPACPHIATHEHPHHPPPLLVQTVCLCVWYVRAWGQRIIARAGMQDKRSNAASWTALSLFLIIGCFSYLSLPHSLFLDP